MVQPGGELETLIDSDKYEGNVAGFLTISDFLLQNSYYPSAMEACLWRTLFSGPGGGGEGSGLFFPLFTVRWGLGGTERKGQHPWALRRFVHPCSPPLCPNPVSRPKPGWPFPVEKGA